MPKRSAASPTHVSPEPADGALGWLLDAGGDPAVRLLARRDLLGQRVSGTGSLASPTVRGLLAGQQADGGFGVHPYAKWGGAHWRLVSLVELGIPPGHDAAVAAAQTVLDHWSGVRRLAGVRVV